MIRSVKFTLFLLLATAATTLPPSPRTSPKRFARRGTWNLTVSRKPLIAVEQFAQRSSGDPSTGRMPAAGIASLLADPKTTAAARGFLCQKLGAGGNCRRGASTGSVARRSRACRKRPLRLQGMQSPEADAALREALRH